MSIATAALHTVKQVRGEAKFAKRATVAVHYRFDSAAMEWLEVGLTQLHARRSHHHTRHGLHKNDIKCAPAVQISVSDGLRQAH